MPKILEQFELAANTNPAEALAMLPELMQAYHEGLIVELPCEFGTTIYKIALSPRTGSEVVGIMPMTGHRIYSKKFDSDDIGTEFYFTREAAEERLESEK